MQQVYQQSVKHRSSTSVFVPSPHTIKQIHFCFTRFRGHEKQSDSEETAQIHGHRLRKVQLNRARIGLQVVIRMFLSDDRTPSVFVRSLVSRLDSSDTVFDPVRIDTPVQ